MQHHGNMISADSTVAYRVQVRDYGVRPQKGGNVMKEVTEDLIERYVGYPDSLGQDVRCLVEAKLATDGAARQIAEFYREYYAQLRNASSTENHPTRNE